MHVTFDHSEPTAAQVTTFWFKPDKPLRYTAGQFTQIHLPHKNMDKRGDKRWFTLSSSPTDELLSITTKLTPKKGSSFKRTLLSLQPGTKLTLADPMGDFVLPKDPKIPLLFVASGIGITPMHSMIKWLHDTGEKRTIRMLHGVQKPDQLTFRQLFETYDLVYTPLVQKPEKSWQGETGSLSTARILKEAIQSPKALIYLSGPEPMTEKFVTELKQVNIPEHYLVTDYFPGYTEI